MKLKPIFLIVAVWSLLLSSCPARADVVLQPGSGLNDGTDDGSAAKGKDASVYRESVTGGVIANGGAEALVDIYNSPCNVPYNGGLENAYLQFSTNTLPAQNVTNATIEVYCRVFYNGCGWPWPTNPVVSMRRVIQAWNEMTVNADTSPATDPAILDSHTITVVHGGVSGCPHPIFTEFEGWLSFDVTSTYLGWVSGAITNCGVEFRLDTAFCQNGDVFQMFSSDHTNVALRPKLVLRMPSAITSTNQVIGEVGTAFTYQISAYDGPTWFNAFGLPAGLTVNTNTGLISGTPTNAGIYSVQLQAGNTVLSNSANLTIDIMPRVPVITSPTNASCQVAVNFAYQIVTENNPTWIATTLLPDGLFCDGAGLIAGIPTTPGFYSVQLFAGNRSGTNSLTLFINVLSPAPAITSPLSGFGEVRKQFSYTITATNVPTSYGVSNLPAWLAFDSNTGLMSGTPTNSGRYSVQLFALNPYGTGTAMLSLVITNPSITYTQDFENGMVGWTTASSFYGMSPWFISDTNSGAAHGGTHFGFTGTVRGQTYASQANWLISPIFSAATTNSWLQFWDVYGLNDYWAYGKVNISVNGAAYQEIASFTGYPFGLFSLPGPVTNANQYAHEQIYLGSYLKEGDTYTLQFVGLGRDGSSSPGWMIDDVMISGVMFVPEFTSARLTGAMKNAPFKHQLAADYATGFTATGLPPGLSLDGTTGLISGTPTVAGAFDVTITATNAMAPAVQILRVVVNDNTSVLWREDFNNGLSAAWASVPSDTSYFSFPTGTMKLRANNGETWTSSNRGLNLFALNTPTAGDFMLTMGVSKCALSVATYPGLFLTAWDDTDNNVRFGYQASASTRSGMVAIESGQAMTYTGGTNLDFGSSPFVLRLVKQGNQYSCWWSTNGTDFVMLGSSVPAAYGSGFPRQLGLWFGVDPNLSDIAYIDYIEVSAVTMTNAGAPPVFASGKVTGGLQGSPFVWESSAAYATGFTALNLPPGLVIGQNGRITGTPSASGVYDSTITATNAFGATSQTLRLVISPSATSLFHEDFNGGLSASWTAVPSDTNFFGFPIGMMNLRANYGDTWQSAYNRPLNLFAVNTPTAGDFMVTLGIRRFVPSARNNPGIFLTAWDDTDNLVRFSYAGSTTGPGPGLNLETHAGTAYNTGIAMDFSTNAFAMRLVKRGSLYSVWWSTNGVDFVTVPGVGSAAYANFVPRQLGFWMGADPNQSDTMLIDYFDVSMLTMTNAGTLPVVASANLTGALQGSPFVWEVSAAYATGFSASNLPPGLSIAPQNGRITGTPTLAGMYDSTVTATNIFGFTNQTLRIVVRNPVGVIFRDDFNAGYATNWTATPTNYVTSLPGIERVRANNGDVVGTLPVPFVVPMPAMRSFTLTLGLTRFVPGTWNNPGVWLMAWQDFDHDVRFGPYGHVAGSRAQFGVETSPGAYTATADYAMNFGAGPFLIRMNVTNNVYSTAFSSNGVDFISLPGSYTLTAFTNTQAGFWAGIDPYQSETALVDYFELSGGMPTIISPAMLVGVRNQMLTWQIATENSAWLTAAGLPPGLTLDGVSGLISGIPTNAGLFNATITASNAMAVVTQNLRCIISDPAVAPALVWDAAKLPLGLIAWWQAESNMLDSANHHDGTGSPAPTYANGRYGQAFQFNGISQSVAIPDSYPDLDNWSQFTLEAWINFDQVTDYLGGRAIFSKVGGAGGNNGYQFAFDGNGTRINLAFNKSGQAWPGYITTKTLASPLVTNTWYHLAATYDNNAVKIYLNGVPLITNVVGSVTLIDTGSPLRISKDDNGNCPFAGRIDDARIYNRALTANEIAYLYQGPPANPIATWTAGFGFTGSNTNYDADPDHDGLKNIFEYAFNQNPSNSRSAVFPSAAIFNDHLVLNYRQRIGGAGTVGVDYIAGWVGYRVEVADSLSGPWSSSSSILEQVGSAVNNGDGTETVTVQLKQSIPAASNKFMRLSLIPQ